MWPLRKTCPVEAGAGARVIKPREKSKRPQLSCNACRARKVKCDRVQPCTACSLHQIASSCRYDLTDAERQPILQAEALREKDREIARLQQQVDALGGSLEPTAAPLLPRKKRRCPSSSGRDRERRQHLPPLGSIKPGGPSAGAGAAARAHTHLQPHVPKHAGGFAARAHQDQRPLLPTRPFSHHSSRAGASEAWEAEVRETFGRGEPLYGSLKLSSSDIQSTLGSHGGAPVPAYAADLFSAGEPMSAPVSCAYAHGLPPCSAPSYPPSLYGSSGYAQSAASSSLHTPSVSHPVSPTLSHSQAYCISQPQTQPQSPAWAALDGAGHCVGDSAMAAAEKEYQRDEPWAWKLPWAG